MGETERDARLNETERDTVLGELREAGWEMVEGRDAITKSFKFETFLNAWGWMTQVAMVAETMDHHPEWSNTYNSVDVTLSTHDAGGLTRKDVRLARAMDELKF